MFRRGLAFGTLLVAVLGFFSPGPAFAAGRGGAGIRVGGFGAGGFRGGYHPSYAGYHAGGWYRGGLYYGGYNLGGYYPFYGGYSYPYYGAYSYPYYGGYSYPYYGGYYPYYSLNSYGYSDLLPGAEDVLSPPSVDQQSSALTSGSASGTGAHVTVSVPVGARVWIDDKPTDPTGTYREYTTPPLAPARRYAYAIKASWIDNGREVTQTQKVQVSAGDYANVRFPVAQGSAANSR
jgi:uncharacterized protein (TIGR03000 family)